MNETFPKTPPADAHMAPLRAKFPGQRKGEAVRYRVLLAASVVLVMLSGCSKLRPQPATRLDIPPNEFVGVTALRDSAVGRTTTDGRLIFFEWNTGDGDHHGFAALDGDYGMMIFYDMPPLERRPDWKATPPRFELYLQKEKRIIRTSSLNRFEKELARIPRGKKIRFYDTCSGGTHWGLDETVISQIDGCCKKNGVVLTGAEYRICTCP